MQALQRRLSAEWDLLHRLAERNPGRLTDLAAHDLAFTACLRNTPALAMPSAGGALRMEHPLQIMFPRHYPAAPMEMFLDTPVQHPNIHPETGFVCLWDRHRVSHTVEHAFGKLVRILGWQLFNTEAVHVMQPDALIRLQQDGPAIAAALASPPLLGIEPGQPPAPPSTDVAANLRRRLS